MPIDCRSQARGIKRASGGDDSIAEPTYPTDFWAEVAMHSLPSSERIGNDRQRDRGTSRPRLGTGILECAISRNCDEVGVELSRLSVIESTCQRQRKTRTVKPGRGGNDAQAPNIDRERKAWECATR